MHMPTLNALRAFEVAARTSSIKAAAGELCVTPSAISQMIRKLETELGVALFVRAHRAITLSPAGQALLPAVRNGFRHVAEAVERVRVQSDDTTLTIAVTPFFAETWLVPRLGDFCALHPALDVRIAASSEIVDPQAGGADVAIRHGLGRHAGMTSDLLVAPAVVPVATPGLVAARGYPDRPEDLLAWPRLHDAERGAWARWFGHMGVPSPGTARGLSFDDSGLLRAAIIAGQGAGLLPAGLVAPDIGNGRLVALSSEAVIGDLAYYLVAPTTPRRPSSVAAFRAWLLDALTPISVPS